LPLHSIWRTGMKTLGAHLNRRARLLIGCHSRPMREVEDLDINSAFVCQYVRAAL